MFVFLVVFILGCYIGQPICVSVWHVATCRLAQKQQNDLADYTAKTNCYKAVIYCVTVRMFSSDEDETSKGRFPAKHDLISCLAVGGKWVTSQTNLQVCGLSIHLQVGGLGIHLPVGGLYTWICPF